MSPRLKKWAKVGVTVAIFAYLFHRFDLRLVDLFGGIELWPYIALALVVRLVVMQAIAMNRWQLFLRHSGVDEGILALTKISFVSAFMGLVLPSSQGTDVMRMYFIERRHPQAKAGSTASSSVLIERMIGFALIAVLGLCACLAAPVFEGKPRVLLLIGGINAAVAAVIFALVNRRTYQFVSRQLDKIQRFKKIIKFVEKTHYSLVSFPYRKVLLPSVLLIGTFQFCSIVVLYLVFLSFGVDIPFYWHLVFYPIIIILAVIPVSISGLGLREGFFVYFYTLVGVSPEVAVGISLVNYSVEVLSGAVVGGVLYGLKSLKLVEI